MLGLDDGQGGSLLVLLLPLQLQVQVLQVERACTRAWLRACCASRASRCATARFRSAAASWSARCAPPPPPPPPGVEYLANGRPDALRAQPEGAQGHASPDRQGGDRGQATRDRVQDRWDDLQATGDTGDPPHRRTSGPKRRCRCFPPISPIFDPALPANASQMLGEVARRSRTPAAWNPEKNDLMMPVMPLPPLVSP
jgi:hypothetical protein